MNRRLLLASLDQLLPLAARWVAAVERRIEREGVPLLEEELEDARAIGVEAPGRVRLFPLEHALARGGPNLWLAARALHLFTPATRGLALRYGIFVRSDCWRDRRLIAHELVHTSQYERLGGIEPFLKRYLSECLTLGYPGGPLEQEAISVAQEVAATYTASSSATS